MNNLVLRENKDGAAILTLNRPEKLNALSRDMIETLEEHVDAIEREAKTIGLVVLRGAGGNFSAGHDMTEVLAQVKAHAKPHHYVEVIDKVANLPQLLGRRGPRHASGEFLLCGRCLRGRARRACGRHPRQLLVLEPGQ